MSNGRRKQLEIRVAGKPVGVLEQSDPPKHVFTYLPDTPETHFVSLTMPVRAESYVWDKGLHPFFQVNLPEGYRKDFLRQKFGPVATVDDFSLLALTGSSTLGRVTVHPMDRSRGSETVAHGAIADVLTHANSRSALLQYLSETALDAISGVMPKALAADERLTLKTPEWILKTGRDDTPGMCINEYVSLELARKVGIPVPNAKLSEDGEVLALARFDIGKNGESLGLEDMCSLLGMAPSEKYEATAEQITQAVTAFVADSEKLDSSKRFVDMLLLNVAIRNADAHAKNYALLYSGRDDVALAPAYDIVTVHAYKPYSQNPYAILIGGTKGWNLRRPIERLASERLNLSASHIEKTIDRIASEMTVLSVEIGRLANSYPSFGETAKNMIHVWSEGVKTLSGKSRPVSVDLSAAKLSEQVKKKKLLHRT
jgi:serine/threonine-protein kinase HipA